MATEAWKTLRISEYLAKVEHFNLSLAFCGISLKVIFSIRNVQLTLRSDLLPMPYDR